MHHGLWLIALQAFHNLDSLTISSGFYFRPDSSPKDPYREHCINAHSQIGELVGMEEFKCLLLAAGESGRKLKTLRAGLLHWVTFANLDGPRLDSLLVPLEHLTKLCLVISTGTEDDLDSVGNEAEECANALSEGGLARFIKRLPNLHTLWVEFDFYDWENFCFGADSADILAPDGRWPYLRVLGLQCIAFDPEHMEAFFEKHRETLEYLSFADISIPTTLSSFFSKMRDTLNLQEFDAFGHIYGFLEEDDHSTEEGWCMKTRDEDSVVRDALKAFLIDGGEYPLTCERVMELEPQDEPNVYELFKEGEIP
jgi:hypothetical protein